MSTKTLCDGCGSTLRPAYHEIVIRGERANGMGGGGLPQNDFDWCLTCSQIAFNAVRDVNNTTKGQLD